LLEALAVADRGVDADDLARVGGLSPDAMDDALDELDDAQWVSVRDQGPALWVEALAPAWLAAVRGSLSRRRHRALHAAWLGVRLDPLDELTHTLGAGAAADDGAVQRLATAGEQALASRQIDEAVRLLTAARDLGDRRGACSAQVLERLGSALAHRREVEPARAAWEAALTRGPEPGTLARLRRALAMLAWDVGDVDEALAQVQAGWDALEGRTGPDVEALARTELIFLDRMMDIERVTEAADRLEAVASTPEARSEVWQARASVGGFYAHEGAVEAAERAVLEARGVREPRVSARAAHTLNMALVAHGHPKEALQLIADNRLEGTYAMMGRTMACLLLGDVETLRGVVAQVRAVAGPRGLMMAAATASLALATWDPAVAEMDLPPISRIDARSHAFLAVFLAGIDAVRGEHAAVVTRVKAAGIIRPQGIASPLAPLVVRYYGIALARTGDVSGADALATWLATRDPFAVEVAAVLRAEADKARGRAQAGRALDACAATFDTRGLAGWSAATRLSAAEAFAGHSPERARRSLDAAWAHFAKVGAASQLARARELYAAIGARAPATPRRRSHGGPLSVRELEVVRMVARGMSNKEAAKALYVSPSTVATHLKRVYKRLELHNRTALTRWAAEHGHLAE
jgi:DNA-binding CsgD family transcriptional regulator